MLRRRRIAIISEHASPLAPPGGVDSGGQNIYIAHIARQLAKRGCSVDVFTRRDNAAQQIEYDWLPGVRVIHVPAGPAAHVPKEQLLPLMGEFSDFLLDYAAAQRERYEVLHANFFMSGLASKALARRDAIPLVITFHALGCVRRRHQRNADLFPDERIAIEADLVRCADRIVAECPQDFDDLVELCGADRSRIDIVPCGFDRRELSAQPHDAARRRLGWSADEFAILQLGRMVPRKGVDNVIRSLKPLRERYGVRARLFIVGGATEVPCPLATPEIGRLQRIAEDLDVREQVSFLGRRDREALATLYSAADVFVTTPLYEPFGITPVESMACGTPVIGSAVGGIRSTVVDGVTGYLVPPNDPDTLAERLSRLHGNPALRAALGEAGLARAFQNYTWTQVAARLMRVYDRAIGVRRPRRTSPPRRSEAVAEPILLPGATMGPA